MARPILARELVTTNEAAELMGISPRTVRQHVRRGTMPQPEHYVGRSPTWRRSTIQAWVKLRPGRGRPYLKDNR